MFVKLTPEQIAQKIQFMDYYKSASNAATGATLDSNANVSRKNLSTLAAEIHKDFNIQINRAVLSKRIEDMYGEEVADVYKLFTDDHLMYTHDETSLMPYCVSISMYPMLLDGLRKLGLDVDAPKNIESFCGSFINMVYAISAQFAGAVATVEFLMYFDYFARKSWGDNYQKWCCVSMWAKFQQVVHSLNQPAAARGYQSVFWNISVFDKFYFESMFKDFYFPDGTKPDWDSISWLQDEFMNWFNKERTRAELTFPVVTAAVLHDSEGNHKDPAFVNMLARQMSEGNSFFIYQSDNADSLSSCCRLRNEMIDNTFSYSLGAGGVGGGSVKVMTLNLNRFFQRYVAPWNEDFYTVLTKHVQYIQYFLHAYQTLVVDNIKAGMLPVYDAGFIDIKHQYITVGIAGGVEAAEFLGYKPNFNGEYMKFLSDTLRVIKAQNKAFREKTGLLVNTEFVPAESLGVKFATWDKKDGLTVPRDCYNSYFYPVEDEYITILDKLMMYNKDVLSNLDGGSALHLNLEELPSYSQALHLIRVAAVVGCNYFCTNVLTTICNDCGFIGKETNDHCVKCGSHNVDHATRVIGYLKRVSSFSEARQREHSRRVYHKTE